MAAQNRVELTAATKAVQEAVSAGRINDAQRTALARTYDYRKKHLTQ